ncbi:uncharacterized protein LOC126618117 [Malus sylvestris]|uniref:uncharacterized protein LOC126618117 n=1 Tax=Malus sylvestris TaxID=3752 RepID=UPI0021AC7814|nr:uncharacterized protein LOC126618117 [Malus sylvestris]
MAYVPLICSSAFSVPTSSPNFLWFPFALLFSTLIFFVCFHFSASIFSVCFIAHSRSFFSLFASTSLPPFHIFLVVFTKAPCAVYSVPICRRLLKVFGNGGMNMEGGNQVIAGSKVEGIVNRGYLCVGARIDFQIIKHQQLNKSSNRERGEMDMNNIFSIFKFLIKLFARVVVFISL